MNKTMNHEQADESEDKPWTRQELTVYSNGTLALAIAVVDQWKKDGCPKRDEQAIKYWQGVIDQYEN